MPATLQESLGALPLFRGLAAAELSTLATCMRERELPYPGIVLFDLGDPSDGAYLVRSGLLACELPLPDGPPLEVARIGPGSVVGELCLVKNGARTLRVRCLEPTTLYQIDREKFADLRAVRNPAAYKLIRNICVMVCDRLRNTNHFIESELRQEQRGPEAPETRAKRKGIAERARGYLAGLFGR
jgi:CRP-like cAMP-binding protein